MWQPDSRQWKIIWIAVVIAFVLWLLSSTTPSDQEETVFTGLAAFVVLAGGLRVWMLQGRR